MSFAGSVIGSVKTNFTMAEILSLAKNYKKFIGYPLVMNRIPSNAECKMINKQSVLVADLNLCRKELLDFIYERKVNAYDGGTT